MRREEIDRIVLEILMNAKDGFVSGKKLASLINVSRPTIHRIINDLRSKGYLIESNPHKGYRLILEDDLRLANYYIANFLKVERVKYTIVYLEKCSSTQDIAELLARHNANEGVVVVAEEMTHGKGRIGRKWEASRGGLWFTVLLRPKHIVNLLILSLGASIAVCHTINELYGITSWVGWPNEILVGNKKVAGVLIEGKMEADIMHYVLVGIGINVNNSISESLADKAVSLRELIGKNLPRMPLFATVLSRLDTIYKLIEENKNDIIIKRWRNLSITIGNRIIAYTGTRKIIGKVVDIDENGALVVESNGKKIRVHNGHIYYLDQNTRFPCTKNNTFLL